MNHEPEYVGLPNVCVSLKEVIYKLLKACQIFSIAPNTCSHNLIRFFVVVSVDNILTHIILFHLSIITHFQSLHSNIIFLNRSFHHQNFFIRVFFLERTPKYIMLESW